VAGSGITFTWTVNAPILLYHPEPSITPKNNLVAPVGIVIFCWIFVVVSPSPMKKI